MHEYFFVGSSDIRIECPIFLCRMDYRGNQLSVIDSFAGCLGSSYLALSPGHRFLYAVDKRLWDTSQSKRTSKRGSLTGEDQSIQRNRQIDQDRIAGRVEPINRDQEAGGEEPINGDQMVSAFRVDPESFRLTYLNSQSSRGTGPCHISCNKNGSFLFVANYRSGSLAVLPIAESGKILPATNVYKSTGSGPHPSRQDSPHLHYVSLDPEERFLYSPDLGTDRVHIFQFDSFEGKVFPNPVQPFFQTAAGAGPRHLDFHPQGDFMYLINELNGTLTAYRYNKSTGEVAQLNTLSTLPENFSGSNTSAAVRTHPNGRFVYASNRGEVNSIAVFRILKDGGIRRIQVIENVPGWPRDFNIHPGGRLLLVAGEKGNEIEVFRINGRSGKLSASKGKLTLRSPANILFPGSMPDK